MPIAIIISGFWKFESYEIYDKTIIKYNLGKIISKKIDFDSIINFKQIIINTDSHNNPFNIIKFISKNQKYFIYKKITITTNKNKKIVFDERFINTNDFKELLKLKKRKFNFTSITPKANTIE